MREGIPFCVLRHGREGNGDGMTAGDASVRWWSGAPEEPSPLGSPGEGIVPDPLLLSEVIEPFNQ
jgi:hypothetical protein